MEFYLKESKTTPRVEISPGLIIINGRSIPEDAFGFYEPILEACQQYTEKPPKSTSVKVYLEYVNSGSKKYLMNIFSVLEKSYLEGNPFEILWTYDSDDESILDLGNDLKSIIKIPLTIQPAD